jgi:predicted NUDIX family NTP pyrophosphohydrolase
LTKRSAGILPYRVLERLQPEVARRSHPQAAIEGNFEVLLGHSGGPLWARRDAHAWTIPKGEYGDGETALEAARREFAEELGLAAPAGEARPLGEITQRGGKIVTAWALAVGADGSDRAKFDQAELDLAMQRRPQGSAAMFWMEWPRGSGRLTEFPEIDRVQWFTPSAAAGRMFGGQQEFLDRLAQALRGQSSEGSPR